MKSIRLIITLLLLVGYGVVYGQSMTMEDALMKSFGQIRMDMVKSACEVLGYNDNSVIDKLKVEQITSFCSAIEAKKKANPNDSTLKYLVYIIGDAQNKAKGGLSGEDYLKYRDQTHKFRKGLLEAFTKPRLASVFGDNEALIQEKLNIIQDSFGEDGIFDKKIKACAEECGIFMNQPDQYKNTYPEGIFNKVAEKPASGNVKKEEVSPTSTTNQEKNDWENCKNFENCIQYLSNYPEGAHRKNVVDKAWNMLTKEMSNPTKKNFQDYANVLNDGEKHKNEAEKKIEEFERDEFLQNCETPDEFEEAIKKWGDDSDFKDKVYEKFWSYCENAQELDNYLRYKEDVGLFGKHYKEAKERIKKLQESKVAGREDSADGNSSWYIVGTIVVTALLLAFFLRKRKKNQTQSVTADKELREENAAFERCSTISACDYYLNTYPNGRFVKEVIVKKEGLSEKMRKEEDEAFKACTTITACDLYLVKYPDGKYVNEVKEKKTKLIEEGNKILPKEEPEKELIPEPSHKQGEWVVVGASVKGNGHIESNMPCQDNNKFELLGKGWGIAVVSDGAGSAAHSEMGSKVVVERGVHHFKNLVEKEGWMEKNTLPTDVEWLQKSYFVMKTIRNEVEMVAKKNNVELKSLSATCLVVVFSPLGLLAVHVGDGRMGCKTASGGWKAIMTPHKGDEANQTLFLVSEFWDIPNYVQSGVLVPESIVVREPVEAFALMSDGCESTAWLCTAQNAETGKYYDQNKPFEGFFNPLEETLVSFHKDNVPEEERKEKWYNFIESGTKGFVKEQDDKTMIFGVFCRK